MKHIFFIGTITFYNYHIEEKNYTRIMINWNRKRVSYFTSGIGLNYFDQNSTYIKNDIAEERANSNGTSTLSMLDQYIFDR